MAQRLLSTIKVCHPVPCPLLTKYQVERYKLHEGLKLVCPVNGLRPMWIEQQMPASIKQQGSSLLRSPLTRLGALLALVLTVLYLFSSKRAQTNIPLPVGRDGKELLLVQGVFRHGARTPLSFLYYPDVKWANCGKFEGVSLSLRDENGHTEPPPILDEDSPLMPGGCRMGELTHNGYAMATDFGAWLRYRYTQEMPFLSSSFKREEVMLRTTCMKRTVATLKGVLTGLYPDAAQPGAPVITVNASQESHEIEYGKNKTCPALGPQQDQLLAMVTERDAKDAVAMREAERVAGRLGLSTPALSWVRLHDMFAAMQAEGMGLPQGADKKMAQQVSEMAIERESAVIAPVPQQKFLEPAKCEQVIRRGIGPLLQRIIANMHQAAHNTQQQQQQQSVSSGQEHDDPRRGMKDEEAGGVASTASSPKLYLFSGHDSTITPILAALGAPLEEWPPFVANVVFELWGSKKGGVSKEHVDDLEVRLLYDRQPLLLKHSSKGGWIRLGDLQAQLALFAVDGAHHQEECKLPALVR